MSLAGDISKSVERAAEIGAEAIQLFGSSPQTWAFKTVPDDEIDAFRQALTEAEIGLVLLQAIYWINMGSQKEDILEEGVHSVIDSMELAATIGLNGAIFHPGSHGGTGYDAIFPQAVSAIQSVLERSPKCPCLLLDNM